MNKSILNLLACAALVACAPGPDGAVGAAGIQGAQGEQGIQGPAGVDGADAPAREGSVVAVTGGTVTAGASAEIHVLAQYTQWTEAPVISTDYDGLAVSAVVTSPVSMIITITAEPEIRGGEANLIVDGLQLTKTVEVIPAARFVPNEGQTNQVRPGQAFAGRIELAPGFGFSGSVRLKTKENDDSDDRVILTPLLDDEDVLRPFLFDGRPGYGVTTIILEGVVAPNTAAGVMNWSIENRGGDQIIPVHRALEVSDSPATELELGSSVDETLENGFGLYRITGAQGAPISAGAVVRAELLNADFAADMKLSIQASGDDAAVVWSNEDTLLRTQSNTIEIIAPRSGVFFLTVDHADGEAGAEFTFTASAETVTIQPATGQDQEVVLARPGHGAWFARSVAVGQNLFWSISPSDESDASPVSYIYYNFTDDDGNDTYGAPLSFNGSRILSGNLLDVPDGITWPDSLSDAVFIWRVVDAQLGGGGGYGITFNGGVR